jgi:hypothetical protein
MLKSQKNWLAHPRKWDDPFENFILNSPIEVSARQLAHSQARNDVYGQCWSLHKEADLMWRAYSPQTDAIKVQTTVELLLQSLLEACGQFKELSCFIGKVQYLTKEKIAHVFDSANLIDPTGAGIARTLLVKRLGFRSEREVRLIFLDNRHQGQKGFFKYHFDVGRFIGQAVLDPRMPDDKAAEWTTKLRGAGFSGKLFQSSLYRPPDFKVFRNRL